MKLWVFSDIHLESCAFRLPDPPPEADAVVIAGDLMSPFSEGVRWIAENLAGRDVVYVPGNHEWYGTAMDAEMEKARGLAAAVPGLRILQNEAAVIGGVRFLGATLWTDYQLYGDPDEARRLAEKAMSDHYVIANSFAPPSRFRPADAEALHRESRAWLENTLAELHGGPTVVVTHHLPHPRSIDEQYEGSLLNPAFASDLSGLVEKGGAAMWIHGHTHSSFDYRAGGARVICNPKGYGPRGWHPRPPENGAFDPSFVVAVE